MRGGLAVRSVVIGVLSGGWGLYLSVPLVAVTFAAAAFAVIVEATIQ